ncbi:retrovirus-related pol polyprotein from transposon TNT 1-94 [Tanacetum coccineum]
MITSQQSLDMEIMFKAISRYVTYTMLKASDTTCFRLDNFVMEIGVAFRSKTFYVQNLEGDDLLTGSRESNLCTISISELVASSLVCLMSKATSKKSWLWHRRLSHLNFGTINQFTSKDLVDGIPKFKYNKDHLCIVHNTLIARTPQQNGVVECRNCTLVEAARTMLIFLKTLKFLWDEAIATACFTQNRSIIHTRSLCYLIKDHDDLRKMKPKADISIFIGYSESSQGFCIYNRRTKKLMEMIHAKYKELIAMASECNNLGPSFNCLNFQDSSEDSQSIPSKTDLDNLFSPLFEEYYSTSTLEVSDNSTANTLDNEDTLLSSSIVIEEDEAPQILSSSVEPVVTEPNTLVSNENADELVQKDIAKLNGNFFYNPLHTLVFEEADSSSTYEDPLNVHEFHQTHRSSDMWTKNHPIEQVTRLKTSNDKMLTSQ